MTPEDAVLSTKIGLRAEEMNIQCKSKVCIAIKRCTGSLPLNLQKILDEEDNRVFATAVSNIFAYNALRTRYKK